MSNCRILDCTLRDGGYINFFDFGYLTIKDVIQKLTDSNVDIIECGFLKSGAFDKNKTLFGSIESIKDFIVPKKENTLYVAMIAYGDISNEEICDCDGSSVDGIRLTFHQDQIDDAFELGKKLIDKNYKVFMQPVGTTSYSDEQLLDLVNRVNNLSPYAFYMVDTLGIMFKEDLLGMFTLVDEHLHKDVCLGFHSHNNLQLSFANALELLSLQTARNIIIDSSVFGMGRGAGNLCTELIMKYINSVFTDRYDVVPVLEIFDEHINKILLKYKWGYSLPYYIASMNKCHPNYAAHLINKQTITIKDINKILSSMEDDKRDIFDKNYIEDLYIAFQKHNIDDSNCIEKIIKKISNRNIVVIAPGKSIKDNKNTIINYCKRNNSVVFSVNFISDFIDSDYIFVSNQKRFRSVMELRKTNPIVNNVIITSNLLDVGFEEQLVINYSDYLSQNPIISDNAGLILLHFLCKINVKEVNLVGFDGFSMNGLENYYDSEFTNSTEYENLIEKTNAIADEIKKLSNKMKVNFLTKSRYEFRI